MRMKRARYEKSLTMSTGQPDDGETDQKRKRQKCQTGGICNKSIPDFLAGATSQLCRDCVCMVHGCGKPRVNQQQFCKGHGKEALTLDKGSYMSARGQQKFHPTWCSELKLVASHGWMLNAMTPCDLAAFFAGAGELVGCAMKVDGRDLLNLYTIAVMKLPMAIEAWIPLAVGPPVVSEGGPAAVPHKKVRTAADFADASVTWAHAVSKKDATWEVQQLQTGNQNLLLGPFKFSNLMGMCSPNGESGTTKHVGCIEGLASASRCEDTWEILVALADEFHDPTPLAF